MSGTATATKPKPATAPLVMVGHQPPRLTHADFMHHMTAMNAHYKAANSNGGLGPTHVYTLPIHMMFPPIGAVHRPTQGKAEVDAALSASKATTTAFAQNQKSAVDTATNKLQGNHDTAGFAAAMNAQRQKAKEESDRHIDDTFNKLIEIGTKHPEQQHRILSVTQQIGAFFTSLLANVARLLHEHLPQDRGLDQLGDRLGQGSGGGGRRVAQWRCQQHRTLLLKLVTTSPRRAAALPAPFPWRAR